MAGYIDLRRRIYEMLEYREIEETYMDGYALEELNKIIAEF